MSWKSFIPFIGKHSVRKRIRQIKHLEISLPVLLATSVTKLYESFITGSWANLKNWLAATVVVSGIYIYWDVIDKLEDKVKEEF